MIYAADKNGRFAGVFVGGRDTSPVLPPGLTRVTSPPPHPDAVWVGDAWDITTALTSIRREAAERLNQGIDEATSPLKSAYPETERDTWDQQALEAEALLADPNAPAPLIREIASAIGVDPVSYAQGVKAKADAFRAVGAAAVAQRQKARAVIASAQTVDEINAAVTLAIDAVRAVVQQAIGA